MRKLILILSVFTTTLMAQNRETHTCIICGYEWEEVVEGGGWTTQGKLTTLSSFLRKQEGKKWDVYLHDEAWLCNHCYNLYAEKWKDKLKQERVHGGFNSIAWELVRLCRIFTKKLKGGTT